MAKSIEITQEKSNNGKTLYSLAQKKFESIPCLVSYYRTYDFAEILKESASTSIHRLGTPLPYDKWLQELQRQAWYQPDLSRQQANELLLGVSLNKIKYKTIFTNSFIYLEPR